MLHPSFVTIGFIPLYIINFIKRLHICIDCQGNTILYMMCIYIVFLTYTWIHRSVYIYVGIWLPMCVSYTRLSRRARLMRYKHIKSSITSIWSLNVIQVNRNTIYGLLYVCHINFVHDMHHSEDTTHYKLNHLDLTFKGHIRSKVMRSTKIPYMSYYMCFI